MEHGFDQWLYENLIVVLLAGFSGIEILRRAAMMAWAGAQSLPLEALADSAIETAKRSAQFAASLITAQLVVGKFAKEELVKWPEPSTVEDFSGENQTSKTPVQLRLCGGNCSGM